MGARRIASADEKDKLFCISNREDAAELCSRMLYADCYFRCDCTESNTRLVLSKARKQVFEDSTEAAYIITYEGSHWLRYLIGCAASPLARPSLAHACEVPFPYRGLYPLPSSPGLCENIFLLPATF